MSGAAEHALGNAVQESWRRFLDTYEPLRPDLHRYCRYLTRSPWDAEDMVQETLARAFVTLGMMGEPPRSPRAWLFRVASNLWLNQVRRRREIPAAMGPEAADARDVRDVTDMADAAAALPRVEPRDAREAAGTLIARLSPQERAAIVLKDAFDLSLDEIAQALSTTVGAVKAALHRGRCKLVAPEPEAPVRAVAPAVLDAFCDAFNARDLERLTALLLDASTMEYPGFKVEYGADEIRAGSFQGTLFGCPEGGFELVAPPRCEVRVHGGEPLFLWWSGAEVHAVVRVFVDGDRIARLVNYYHAPEVVAEVCEALRVPFRGHGYHGYRGQQA